MARSKYGEGMRRYTGDVGVECVASCNSINGSNVTVVTQLHALWRGMYDESFTKVADAVLHQDGEGRVVYRPWLARRLAAREWLAIFSDIEFEDKDSLIRVQSGNEVVVDRMRVFQDHVEELVRFRREAFLAGRLDLPVVRGEGKEAGEGKDAWDGQ